MIPFISHGIGILPVLDDATRLTMTLSHFPLRRKLTLCCNTLS